MADHIKSCPPGFVDFIYKEEAGVSIPLRLWSAGAGAKNAPWLFWIHGGGWLAGKHYRPNYWINPAFTSRGYHVVSVAYRYIPQVSIEDSIQDLKDAMAWCRTHLPVLLGKDAIDLDAYAVGGDSAGGSFSTQSGHLLEPRPRVVIDLYGVTDFTASHYNSEVSPDESDYAYPLDQVKKAVNDRDPKNALVTAAFANEMPPEVPEETLAKLWGTPYVVGEKDRLRSDVYRYITSHHLLFKIGFRRDECANEDAWLDKLRAFSSLHMLDEKKGYPPTAILQGTADSAVPADQSYRFEARLKELKVPVFSRFVKDAEHEFEGGVTEPTDPLWKECIAPLMDFVDDHINGTQSKERSGKVVSMVQWSYE